MRPSTQNWRKATQALACGGAAYRRTTRAAGLNAAAVGSTLTLAGVDLSVAKRLRLAELGLRAGAVVTVLSRTIGGGRLIGVGPGRVALDSRSTGPPAGSS